MRKYMIIAIALLFCIAMFASCEGISDASPHSNPAYTVPSSPTDSDATALPVDGSPTENLPEEGSPSIERYAFFSIADFKLYCSTGSKDVSLYQKPPMDSVFPPYGMAEGCFVELSQLFPELDMNSITVDYVEISSENQYSYSGYTNTGNTPFSISISYKKDTNDVSPEKVVSTANTSMYNQIIYDDYYGMDTAISDKTGAILYIFELSRCTVQYDVYKEKIQGMAIHCGDYVIGISPGYSDNNAFFTDESLSPISCLFKDGNNRDQALNKVALCVNSKG